jgi:hypothetical protein
VLLARRVSFDERPIYSTREMTKNVVIGRRHLGGFARRARHSEGSRGRRDNPGPARSVFPYDPLRDPDGNELTHIRDEAKAILLELADEAELNVASAEVIASNWAARELQHTTEERRRR